MMRSSRLLWEWACGTYANKVRTYLPVRAHVCLTQARLLLQTGSELEMMRFLGRLRWRGVKITSDALPAARPAAQESCREPLVIECARRHLEVA